MDTTQNKVARLNRVAKMVREKHESTIYYAALITGMSVDYARKELKVLPEIYDDIEFDGIHFRLKEKREDEDRERHIAISKGEAL